MKKRTLKAAVLVDFMGTGDESMEEERARHRARFERMLPEVRLEWSEPACPIFDEGTELVVYDFGGVGYGSSLPESNARALLQWAQEHPSALVVIVSSFTFEQFIEPEMRELGLSGVPNIVNEHEDPFAVRENPPAIPEWWLAGLRTSTGTEPSIIATDTPPRKEQA